LVGGDSGGPLFDLNGKVIGIHSRIGMSIATNIHVPVNTYRETWDRLAKGEIWGGRLGRGPEPFLGVEGDREAKECRLLSIFPGSGAEKAGLKVNDVVTRFGDKRISNYDELVAEIGRRKPGDEVTVEVQRGDQVVTVRAVIGKRDG
jgi:serine protease Do